MILDLSKLDPSQLGIAGLLAFTMLICAGLIWSITHQILIPLFIARFMPARVAAQTTTSAAVVQVGADIVGKLEVMLEKIINLEHRTTDNKNEIDKLRPIVHRIPGFETVLVGHQDWLGKLDPKVDCNATAIAEMRGEMKHLTKVGGH